MQLDDILRERRSYRALETARLTEADIKSLAGAAALAPSCYNNQPWRFVFATGAPVLEKLYAALSPGNEWARAGAGIAAVFAKKDADCVLKDGREYYLFDTGIAAGFLMLKATDMGLVTHPIAGYNQAKVKEILNIPGDMLLIALIVIGKHAAAPTSFMTAEQRAGEAERPPRQPFEKFAWIDRYGG